MTSRLPAESGLAVTETKTTMVSSDPKFNFPYETPYSIQLDLMRHLYSSMAKGQVTVIESPTGTGKSLSLISSALTYLNDTKTLARSRLSESIRAALSSPILAEPEWVIAQEIERQVALLERDEKELGVRLERIREREKLLKRDNLLKAQQVGIGRKRMRLDGTTLEAKNNTALSEEDFLPDPYFDSGMDPNLVARNDDDDNDNLSPAVRALMKKLAPVEHQRVEEEEPDVRKIFFASRTHSQLSQFISELRKTSFASSWTTESPSLPTLTASVTPELKKIKKNPIRTIPLGSRQQLCINEEVLKKSGGSNEAIGDLCAEMQKAGKQRCKYLPPTSEPTRLNEFRDRALASVHDIEDIEELGRSMHTCPYYGSRKAIRSAELVTLPYNLLMQQSAREALDISLKNNIVLIDEAHNIIDTLLSLHSVSITYSVLISLRSALLAYFTKFKNRLKGSNSAYLKQLILFLKGLAEFTDSWAKSKEHLTGEGGKASTFSNGTNSTKEGMITVNELLQSLKGGAIDQVNLLKLSAYLNESKISRKIGSYIDTVSEDGKLSKSQRETIRSNTTRNLHHIQTLILSLVNAEQDGRILLSAENHEATDGKGSHSNITIKYMLLAPSDTFRSIAEEASSVVLAGGTMSPMRDFRDQLFLYLPPERFSTFSCGHIVPKDHIATFAVASGPSGRKFDFTFNNRKDEKLIDELGQAILNICQVVPKGVVVFVPSYDFLNQLQSRWERTGLILRLASKKKPFWEPKHTTDVDLVLREYSNSNAASLGSVSGGILFAVVGAKLSEGINFADDMARAVIICGIPYPNSQSIEIKERMKYLDSFPASDQKPGAPSPGQVLYQNLAFRAVNQSIGRAIRHANDWASIILLDARYQQQRKKEQLPNWLGKEVQSPTSFGQLMGALAKFCRTRVQQ